MIGFFGDIPFETSDKRITTFSNLTRTVASRWHKHEPILSKPKDEFLGPDLETVTFTINLNGSMGINPVNELDKWHRKCLTGKSEILVIGNRGIGDNKWKILSVSNSYNVVFNKGEVYSISVDISLEEYVEEIR